MRKQGLALCAVAAAWAATLALYPAGPVYKPDMSNCGGFTAVEAARILGVPPAAITARSEKIGPALWSCTFDAPGACPISFTVALAKTAEEAAADMKRYRANLELTAASDAFRDRLPEGAWTQFTELGEQSTWTDISGTLAVRQGNVTIQVQLPAGKFDQIRVAVAFIKNL